MYSKFFSILLVFAISQPVFACAALPDAPSAVQAKLKGDVNRFAREQKKVSVRLTTNNNLIGRIQDVGPEQFVVVDAKTGQTTRVSYNEVAEVKKVGLSKGTKILIGVGVAAGALVGLGVLLACTSEGGPHC